jgi:hypothetical protein
MQRNKHYYIRCIIIIIIIIIIALITLFNIYRLGNLHLSQIISGIRLSQGKEIHSISIVKRHVLGICVLYDTFVAVLLFVPLFRMFSAKTIFAIRCRKFLVNIPFADVTKGCICTLFSLQIFLVSRSEYSDFVIPSASVLDRL